MPLSPLCQVRINAGLWVTTLDGVNVTAADAIEIRLVDSSAVTAWYLQVIGVDETSTAPTLASVNPSTYLVTNPATVPTFTVAAGTGRAFLLQSTVTGAGGPIVTTFGLYVLTAEGRRVGAVGEAREGSQNFGWVTKVNPLIRDGGPPGAPGAPGTDGPTKLPVIAATYNPLPPAVLTGNVLTSMFPGPLGLIDGVSPLVDQRLLINCYTFASANLNGIYVVTSLGSMGPPGTNWVLTRASDADTDAKVVSGISVLVMGGTANAPSAPKVFVLTTANPIVLNVDGLTFEPLRNPAFSVTVPLVVGPHSTLAVVGAPEEIGGFFYNLTDYAWASSATLRAYMRTTDGAAQANLDLYDSDAAVGAAPAVMGAVSTLITTGSMTSIDISAMLTNAGGSGAGWMQARLYSADGIAYASSLQAEILFT